jgi:hypothetical protein
MKTIEIDDELYSYLVEQAIPYEDKTPNDTIRRLFRCVKEPGLSRIKPSPQRMSHKVGGGKAPKVRLSVLVDAGILEEGQILHLRDYSKRRKIPNSKATIHREGLLKDGVSYSMSKLAKELFQKEGFTTPSVQGPVYWYTDDNVSIKNIWDEYLEKIAHQPEDSLQE